MTSLHLHCTDCEWDLCDCPPFCLGLNSRMLYLSYQRDNIITRNNNWMPQWKEGVFDSLKSFIMMCMESDPYKRGDKLQYVNHPYILQNHTP
jgi:hypothetical protein